jgi:hypothetical protein
VNAPKPAPFAIRRKCTLAFVFQAHSSNKVFNADRNDCAGGKAGQKSIKDSLAA